MRNKNDGLWHYYGPRDAIPAWTLDAEKSVFKQETGESWHRMPAGYKYPGPLWEYSVGAFPVTGPGETEPLYDVLSVEDDEVNNHGSR